MKHCGNHVAGQSVVEVVAQRRRRLAAGCVFVPVHHDVGDQGLVAGCVGAIDRPHARDHGAFLDQRMLEQTALERLLSDTLGLAASVLGHLEKCLLCHERASRQSLEVSPLSCVLDLTQVGGGFSRHIIVL